MKNLLKNKIIRKKREQGVALVLTIMVISLIIITASSIATLSIIELRASKTVDEQMAAYYVAESGIEHGLFLYNTRNKDELDKTKDYGLGLPWDTSSWCIKIEDNSSIDPCDESTTSSSSFFKMEMFEVGCSSGFRCINSTGHYIGANGKDTKRRLQVLVEKP